MRLGIIGLGVLVIGGCWGSPAFADVRRSNVPEAVRGTWAPSTDLCSQQQKTVSLSATQYTDAQNTCEVRWVEERAGTPGTIYSAHMICRAAGETAGSPKATNLVLWAKESGRVSIGAAMNALVVHERCP